MTPTDLSRRRLLGGVASAPLLAAIGTSAAPTAQAQVRTQARIVIVGSGLGGIAVANRLSQGLSGARITLIDAREAHYYQPGWTLVASGVWPVSKVIDRNDKYHPSGAEWIREAVAEFDPAGNAVVTQSGQRVPYDYLVVATGVQLNYGAIEGMEVAAIGQNGLTSVYASTDAAVATWAAMDAFRGKGGRAVMTLPATPLKCAGAPIKMTFMLADRLRQAGTLAQSQVSFHSSLGAVFGVKAVNDRIVERWTALGVDIAYHQRLTGVDIGSRRATFSSPEGEVSTVDYDFLHVVPPMSAPDVVRRSDLAWQEGPFAAGGWLEVDEQTLRHRRYPNVFGVGDVNGTRRGKTAATVKKSAPMVATNLIDVISGREPSQRFDGYTSCPLILREGSAMLIEFDYDGKLTPTLPMIDPMQESYFAWVMKHRMLKPAYMAVLKGRV
jgi:sulfide:quinone oxidoreductase